MSCVFEGGIDDVFGRDLDAGIEASKRGDDLCELGKVLRAHDWRSKQRRAHDRVIAWDEAFAHILAAEDRVRARQPKDGQAAINLRLCHGIVDRLGLLLSGDESDHGRVNPVQVSQRFFRASVNVSVTVSLRPKA